MFDALAPMLDTAIALVDAAEDMDGSGFGLADSLGISEIAAEAKLRNQCRRPERVHTADVAVLVRVAGSGTAKQPVGRSERRHDRTPTLSPHG